MVHLIVMHRQQLLQTMTDKGRLLKDSTNYAQWLRSLQVRETTLISTKDSADGFSVKLSQYMCMAIAAPLTREMAAIFQHVRSPIASENYCLATYML